MDAFTNQLIGSILLLAVIYIIGLKMKFYKKALKQGIVQKLLF